MVVKNSYLLQHTIRSVEIGPDQRLKIRPLIHLLQESAVGHSRQAGDTFPQQIKRGTVWVLTRLHIQMQRYPLWEETLKINTWSAEIGNLYAVREFQLEDENGSCGVVTSQWILINIQRRRPTRILAELEKGYGNHPVRLIDDPFDPLPSLQEVQFTHPFTVLRCHLDSLNHANNAFYVDWCLESIPHDVISTMHLASIEISFKKEAVYGDQITSESQLSHEDKDGKTFLHHLIRASDNEKLIEARSHWQSVDR